MRRPGRSARRAGFTLVELLLALAIMATLAITGYRALAGMIDSERALAVERERWRALDLLFARLEHDLGHALPRGYRIGGAERPALDRSGDALVFIRANPGEPPQRVGYRWRDERVELLYWPQVDAAVATDPAVYTVAEAIRSWRVALLGADGAWAPEWPRGKTSAAALPEALWITLTLADGTTVERVIAWR